jgi:hypothetical protein
MSAAGYLEKNIQTAEEKTEVRRDVEAGYKV